MSATRSLDDNEQELLRKVLDPSRFDGATELARQIAHAHVVGGLPTLLELAVADSVSPSSRPDGPLPIRALVEGAGGDPTGEVIVWVKGGFLSGLEYAWFTDDTPTAMPCSSALRLE